MEVRGALLGRRRVLGLLSVSVRRLRSMNKLAALPGVLHKGYYLGFTGLVLLVLLTLAVAF
jgi:hypothetical protein